jgi:hypothetical protein
LSYWGFLYLFRKWTKIILWDRVIVAMMCHAPCSSSFVTLFLLTFGELLFVDSLKSSSLPLPLSRRDAAASAAAGIAWGGGFFGLAAPAVAVSQATIADRLTATSLPTPSVKQRSEFDLFSKSGLYDDLFFPSYMAGTWDAVQTLVDFNAPQGALFLTGPQGNRPDVAQQVIAQERAKIGSAVGPYRLRWLTVPNSRQPSAPFVVEDRAYNLKSRLNAFAGKEVVKDVEYVELGGANRIGYGDAPLPTTLTRFKGSAVQKTFSNNRGSEFSSGDETSGTWTGFEFVRTLFARTDSSGRDLPPVVTDTQIITSLRVLEGDRNSNSQNGGDGGDEAAPMVVVGKVRIADYLTPQDQLFFNAKQQAVAISDYDIRLTKVTKMRNNNAPAPAPAPAPPPSALMSALPASVASPEPELTAAAAGGV